MIDTIKIAVLWLIREKQPISLAEIIAYVREEKPENLPNALQGGPGAYLQHGGEEYVRDLIKAGLVQSEDGKAFRRDKPLVVTPRLTIVQDLFDLSLTEILSSREKGIRAYPSFGEPLERSSEWARIFVAMPFLKQLRPIYDEHIAKVARELGISCKRGDDFTSSHKIMDDVWSAIYYAELCIVECTKRNPNVFYEMGIAHTLGRKTILIAQTMKDIPFDVRDWRIIIYDNTTAEGMQEFETKLAQTIKVELGI